MMKKYLIFSVFVFLFFCYLTQTNMVLMHVFNMDKVRKISTPVIIKDIDSIADINGIYNINCKYKKYNYEIGIYLKYDYLPSKILNKKHSFIDISSGFIDVDLMNVNISVFSERGDLICDNKLKKIIQYGFTKYEKYLSLLRFQTEGFEDLVVKIDFGESEAVELPKDLLSVYYRVDTSL